MCRPCQFVEYCPWNVFRQQICHVLQSTQLVERDETDLVQLLNPHLLHFQVFRSAPWSKPLQKWFWRCCCVQRSNLNGSVWCSVLAGISRATIQCNSDSAEDSDTLAYITDKCGTVKHGRIANTPPDVEHVVFGSPVDIHGHMDDVVQLW